MKRETCKNKPRRKPTAQVKSMRDEASSMRLEGVFDAVTTVGTASSAYLRPPAGFLGEAGEKLGDGVFHAAQHSREADAAGHRAEAVQAKSAADKNADAAGDADSYVKAAFDFYREYSSTEAQTQSAASTEPEATRTTGVSRTRACAKTRAAQASADHEALHEPPIMKLYTKTGDDGTTGLFGGGRVLKTCLRVDAYGTVERNERRSLGGRARHVRLTPAIDATLARVQEDLFTLGAEPRLRARARGQDEHAAPWRG